MTTLMSAPEPASSAHPNLALEVLEGPARGARISLDHGGLRLGRGEVPLAGYPMDPEISRKHAIISRMPDGKYEIADLGSANGTFVNGARVEDRVTLGVGDVILLGGTLFNVAEDTGAPAKLIEDASQSPPRHPSTARGQQAPPTASQPVSGDSTDRAGAPKPKPDPTGYSEALARYRAGDVVGAIDLLRICHARDQSHFGTLYGLGMCYARIGDRDEARHWLLAAHQIDAQHAGVAQAIAALGRAQATAPGQPAPIGPVRAPAGSPSPASAYGPRRKPSLAHELDGDAPIDANHLPGKLLLRGHRRLLSHKRLLIGLLALSTAFVAARDRSEIPPSDAASMAARSGLQGLLVVSLILAILCILGAVLSQALTHYEVYERRVDITRGVLFRKRQLIWLYDILDIELFQTPMLMLAGTGTLILQPGNQPPPPLWPRLKSGLPQLRAFGSLSRLQDLQRELLATAEAERRAMKKNWI
jgi:hypothetical protein